jgi:hypothetical protein
MANNKEEAGKGTPRPGDMPGAKRPYATIDATATEIEGRDRPRAGAPKAAATGEPTPRGEVKSSGELPSGGGASPRARISAMLERLHGMRPPPLLTHLAAGAAGALLVLIAWQLPTTERQPVRSQEVGDLGRRLSDVEGVLGQRPGAGLRAKVEELGRSLGALGEAQARLSRETKALDSKVGGGPEIPQELTARLTKLEEALSAAATADPAKTSPQVAALASKIAGIENAQREASEAAKSRLAKVDSELSAIRTEAGRIAQRLDGIKGEVEERVHGVAKAGDIGTLTTRLATQERDMQGFLKSESDRNANAHQIVLALELANLKRAIERGGPFSAELVQAKKLGGFTINFALLERYMLEGVPSLPDLTRSFRQVANAMLDAEAEPANASLLDRLLAGARSIVRVRKSGHAADDSSLEAIIGRMEAALKEGRLAEVLANAKTLPPKAALAGEDWLKKVETRHAVDQAMAEAEATLKASLGASRPAAPEAKR